MPISEDEQLWNAKQESPPAWTQEAYRPPRSKYLLCCSDSWGYLPWLGGGGDTYAEWGLPTLAGGYLPWIGGYLPWPGRGYLRWMGGVPLGWKLGPIPPISWKVGTLLVGWYGYPPPTPNMWTDRKYYLPHPLDAGGYDRSPVYAN